MVIINNNKHKTINLNNCYELFIEFDEQDIGDGAVMSDYSVKTRMPYPDGDVEYVTIVSYETEEEAVARWIDMSKCWGYGQSYYDINQPIAANDTPRILP